MMVKSSIYTKNKGGGDDDPYLIGIRENHNFLMTYIKSRRNYVFISFTYNWKLFNKHNIILKCCSI